MRIDRNQEDFQRIINQSLITEPDSLPISDALHIISGPGDVHEARVTDTNLVVLTGWFGDPEAISHAILDLTRGERRYGLKELMRLPESVYLSLSQVSDDLLALVGNRVKTGVTTTKDHEIVAINRMYLDGDPWRRKGMSSTDQGHSLPISRKIEVRNYLIGMGFTHHYLADSGNGAHLIHATLLDNSPGDRALVEEYIKAASLRLESPGPLEIAERGVIRKIEADLTLKNTTTVMMVSTEQSPPGEATLRDRHQASWSDGFGSIDTEELWAQCGDEPLKPIAGFDLTAQLGAIGVLAGVPKVAGVFTYYPVKECPFNTQHKRVVLSQHRSGTITYLCPHHSCQGKKKGFDRKTARDYFAHYGVTIPGVSWSVGVGQFESDPRSVTVGSISQ